MASLKLPQIKYTRPDKPTDNAFIESFNGKFRDECFNEHWFLNLKDAQKKIGTWRNAYNKERPHSSLNDLTPYEFLKEQIIPLQDERLNLKLAYTIGQGQSYQNQFLVFGWWLLALFQSVV